MDEEKPATTQPKPTVDDFITRMQKSLEAANKNKPKVVQHLSEIVTNAAINTVINETNEEEKK